MKNKYVKDRTRSTLISIALKSVHVFLTAHS